MVGNLQYVLLKNCAGFWGVRLDFPIHFLDSQNELKMKDIQVCITYSRT